MQMPSRDVVVLAAGQALTSTVVSLLTSVSSLSGAHLAPAPALATVPVTASVLGTLAMMYPASALMGRLGRRSGFMVKAGIGVLGGIVCFAGLAAGSFVVLVIGAFLLGLFSAFGQYYRFAAIDAAPDPKDRATAIAVVTGAGVAGGVAGPFLGGRFADAVAGVPYGGAFAALTLVCVCLAASQVLLSADLGRDPGSPGGAAPAEARALGVDFMKASIVCAASFAVMTLTMNAAPLSMAHAGHGVRASATVLQVHFALMYLPSFVNPLIVRRVRVRGLIVAGVAAAGLGCVLAAVAAQTFPLYMLELGLSGIGWNFTFNGGTLLLTETYPAALRTRAQGVNSLIVYCANLLASFSAGVLVATLGWAAVNLACLPLLALALAVLPRRGRSASLGSPARGARVS